MTFGFAGSEAGWKVGLAVRAIGRSVHIFRGYANLEEPLRDVLGVAAIDAKNERRAIFGALEPCLDDVAGERRDVHRLGKLAFVEVAGDGAHVRQIRLARRERHEVREESVADQVARRRRNDQVVIVFAESAAPRRRRKSDDWGLRAVRHPPINFTMMLMGLIVNDEIDIWPSPSRNRLDRAHLNRLLAIGAWMNALYDANGVDALGLECRDGLVDQRKRGDDECDALSSVESAPNDMRRQQRLAAAGRKLKHWAPAP